MLNFEVNRHGIEKATATAYSNAMFMNYLCSRLRASGNNEAYNKALALERTALHEVNDDIKKTEITLKMNDFVKQTGYEFDELDKLSQDFHDKWCLFQFDIKSRGNKSNDLL